VSGQQVSTLNNHCKKLKELILMQPDLDFDPKNTHFDECIQVGKKVLQERVAQIIHRIEIQIKNRMLCPDYTIVETRKDENYLMELIRILFASRSFEVDLNVNIWREVNTMFLNTYEHFEHTLVDIKWTSRAADFKSKYQQLCQCQQFVVFDKFMFEEVF
jgi:hypothetical protein